jgi:hypothetical protein
LNLWLVTLGYKCCGLDRILNASIAAVQAQKIEARSIGESCIH